MLIGYKLRYGQDWAKPVTADDYKDAAVQVVTAYDSDPEVQEYAMLQRPTVTVPWQRIGGATRADGWSARGAG
jgi:hypothetical protein